MNKEIELSNVCHLVFSFFENTNNEPAYLSAITNSYPNIPEIRMINSIERLESSFLVERKPSAHYSFSLYNLSVLGLERLNKSTYAISHLQSEFSLKNERVLTMESCENCNKNINTDIDKFDELKRGIFICEDCTDEVYICSHCNKLILAVEDKIDDSGDCICDDCYNEDFFTCEHCDSVSLLDDSYTTRGGRTICLDCFQNEYSVCEDCNEVLHQDHIYWDENSQAHYCENCLPSSVLIKPYGYQSPFNFLGKKESPKDLDIAFELEVECNGYTSENAQYLTDKYNEDYFVLTEDCTISDGYEITTQPMSIDWLYHNKGQQMLKDMLIGDGLSRGDNCGLHIHVNREAFIDSMHLYRFMALFYSEKSREKIVEFSYRKEDRIREYARFEGDKEDLRKKAENSSFGGKFEAINTSKYKTVEIRLFRSTVRFNTLMSFLEFVIAAFEFTKNATLEQSEDFFSFCVFVGENKNSYSHLWDRLKKIKFDSELLKAISHLNHKLQA